MVDPNRKINLKTSADSSDEEITDEETRLIKEFENEFADRFTQLDPIFVEFLALPKVPIPILEHWNGPQNRRGGGRRGNYNNRRGRGGGYAQRNNYNHNNYNKDHHQRDDRSNSRNQHF